MILPAPAGDMPRLLAEGELEVEGRLVEASNATIRCWLTGPQGERMRCVYKPIAGERPLWDFPDGTLAARETAAYEVSEAVGWRLVPPTLLRDGPLGPGMCQLWVDPVEPALVDVVPAGAVPRGWLAVLQALDARGRAVVLAHADDPRLRRLALLDVVINNADRKGGHVLPVASGQVFGVDHGVTFHVDDKLRTVLWGWADVSLTDEERSDLDTLLTHLGGSLAARLKPLLTGPEITATEHRVEQLLSDNTFPTPADRRLPIPWPAF